MENLFLIVQQDLDEGGASLRVLAQVEEASILVGAASVGEQTRGLSIRCRGRGGAACPAACGAGDGVRTVKSTPLQHLLLHIPHTEIFLIICNVTLYF